MLGMNKMDINNLPKSPVILFRSAGLVNAEELEIAKDKFVTFSLRTSVPPQSLVIGRYSVLPYYKELELDLRSTGSKLINSYSEHRYIADMQNWYQDLADITPKTWFRMSDVPDDAGPLVVKGETNSKKDQWRTHMFAQNKREAIEVMLRLQNDGLFYNQSIYVREFVTFAKYGDNPINGRPVTDEYRFFVLDGRIVAGGFYWSDAVDEINPRPSVNSVPEAFLKSVIEKVISVFTPPRFFVMDVARLPNNEWMVVELNDGQMSGLSECDPKELYKNMKYELWDRHLEAKK